MLELLYATGIRVTELIDLDIGDVNLGAGVIRCHSRNKERFIPMYPAAVKALNDYITLVRPQMILMPDEQSLFVNVSGERMSRQGFWKIVKHYQKKRTSRRIHCATPLPHICSRTAQIYTRYRKCSVTPIYPPRICILSSSRSSSRMYITRRIPEHKLNQIQPVRAAYRLFYVAVKG